MHTSSLLCSLVLEPHPGWGDAGGESHLHVGKVHAVEVAEHLVDLGSVLKYGPGRLCQVIEGCVSPQRLGEGAHHADLWPKTA